ncbi:MAG: Sec-independent protein translocase protein TatB, partial [Parvularculaceae bacterium]
MNLVPQFGFFELVVVAVIALVVIGPRDLPKMMRIAGKAFAQARRMAGEFTAAFHQMAREAEMEEMRQ